MNNQIISHSQDSYLTMKDGGYTISNQHSDTVVGESLSKILDPLALEFEPYIISPSENCESPLVYGESLIE